MRSIRQRFRLLYSIVTLAVLFAIWPTAVRADDRDDRRQAGHEFTVRCDKGKTIGAALAEHDGAVTLKIVGVCDEHVVVNRDDVALVGGAPGAGIHGPDPSMNTLQVNGDRFVLDGLRVTGGRNAIVVSSGDRAVIRNCSVLATGNGIVGGIGIIFFHGANGTIDKCDSSGNPADGLMLDGAIVSITNSTFSSNHRAGILVFGGSSARIGLSNDFTSAGNTIKANATTGVHVTIGSTAVFVGNTISGNGTDPAGPFGRFGIGAAIQSRVDLAANNVITDNFGAGVVIGSGSTAFVGDPGFGLGASNTIRNNSTAGSSAGLTAGIAVALNSTLVVRGATIDKNNGTGILLSGRSVMTVFPTTITNHTANGIQLSQGSAAIFQPVPPLVTFGGNVPFDLKCLDKESSYAGPVPAGATVDCTDFDH
jgi:parallel beta helix pectate lyase-like protein